MLKAKKRLTKRQIKQDKFVTFYFKAQDYLAENSRTILYTAGAIVLILVAIFIYNRKQQEKEQNAVMELTKAKREYFSNNYGTAIPVLQNLTQTYSGTESAEVGLYFLASAYYAQGDYSKAEQTFNQFLDASDDKILSAAAVSGVAACLEEQGKFAEAAERYREAATEYDNFMRPEYMYDSARCYVLAGNKDVARQVLNRLIEDYSDSRVTDDAEILLAEINARA